MGEHEDRTQRITEIFGSLMERDTALELTELLLPAPWAELASKSDVERLGTGLREEMAAQGAELREEMAAQGAELRKEIAAQGAELRKEMAAMGTELHADMAHLGRELRGESVNLRGELRNEIADVRKEVSDLRVEVHDGFAALKGQLPKLIAANIASTVAMAALVLGAVSL